MRLSWSLLFAFAFGVTTVHGQGTLRGIISDTGGETLIGATIVLKADPGVGTITDLDGRYSLAIPGALPTVIVASYVGYEAQEFSVNPKNGEVVILNITLGSKAIELEMFEVEGKARKTTDSYLDRMKINAPATMDFISRETMLKTGDADAAQAVRRISGVSTVGPFVSVRGLADRYLVTSINGSRVPTLDPVTNNLRLDLFPTGLMDNIIITKAGTPDLPGDWTGAYLSMNTSDFPQRLQVIVASTIGYNPNSSFQNIITSSPSSTDWLGQDDGMRGIPEGVPDAVEDFPVFTVPNVHQQLGVLGLGAYLEQYGIVGTTPGFQATTMNNNTTLHHLALTELGLLSPALINDPGAVQNAVNAYNSTYDLAHFSPIVNAELAELNPRFNNANWRVAETQGSPNYNMGFTIGNQLELLKKHKTPKKLGFLVGMRYSAETQFDANSTLMRTTETFDDQEPGDGYQRKGVQEVSIVSNGWNALGNLSFQLDRNNTFSLMGMGNALGQNHARYQEFLNPNVGSLTYVSEEQFWEERHLWLLQYGSKHLIPAYNLTVNADVSYSNGQRDLLDFKVVQYDLPPAGGSLGGVDGALTPPGRIYRFLTEEMLDSRLGFELPLNDDVAKVRKLKFGGSYRWHERLSDQKYYAVLDAPGPLQWEEPGRFEMRPDGRFTSRYSPYGSFKDNDIGILHVAAGYVMLDYALTRRLRVAGGVRAEYTDLISDIRKFYEDGIAPEDPVRGTVGNLALGGSVNPIPIAAKPGSIDQWDVLPSVNLIYKLRDSVAAPVNLRFGYFRSLGRPNFREFSVVQYYDYLFQAPVFGNPNLEMTSVDNLDLRLEYFFANGNNISISGFYKYFENHIELVRTTSDGFTWRNASRSEIIGGEIEGRVKLLRNLEWRGNITVMDSRSDLSTFLNGKEVKYTTPMFGQAPYIVNTTLTQSFDSARFSLSVSYNIQGPRLAVTTSELDPFGIRAYEMPRHVIDITANKQFGTHWAVMFRIRDLLNTPIRRSYLFASGYEQDFDRFTWGTEYLLSVAYLIR